MPTVDAPVLATADVSALPTDVLEEGICSFTARLAAATCVYLLAIAEYSRREAWAEWGCRSMAHWMSWKCAMSLTTAREHVRVGTALADLPHLRRGFRSGRLTYSQVRAVTRVATAESELEFIELARSSTASQLDRVCAAYRRCLPPPEDTGDRRPQRSLTWQDNEDGTTTMTLRLPPEDAAVIRNAIDVAAAARRADRLDRPTPADRPDADHHSGSQHWAAAAVDVAAGYLAADPDARADDPDRYTVSLVVDQAALVSRGATGGPGRPDSPDRHAMCHTADGTGISVAAAARICCDQPSCTIVEDGDGRVIDVGRRTRRIGRRLRRALTRRDGGRCRYPGCDARRTEAHHITHWAAGGRTDMANLISLCSYHHHRHHEGLFTVTAHSPTEVTFDRSDGTPIVAVPTPPTVDGPADCGVHAEVTTSTPDWAGDRLDLPWVIGVLTEHHPPAAHDAAAAVGLVTA